ncbi:PepSY domain-containing protein [Palleronia sp. KMU-117]|uniref:PepSY domain-containing protein n=1 Tax=Palleronia sp. KMU-117 TaxID=3434108 RepID=UPI003D74D7F5
MFKTLATSLALSAALATAALAANPVELTDANTQAITQMLTDQGYEVGKIKIEDGLYEAYAKKGDEKYEIFLNGDFEIVRTDADS